MVSLGSENLLPKEAVDGDAPKTLLLNILLSRFDKSLRKHSDNTSSTLPQLRSAVKIVVLRLPLLLIIIGYLLGYQPVMGFPPIQKKLVHAQEPTAPNPDFIQTQTIETVGLSHPFSLPHPGYMSTHFSSWHPGIDIAIGYGTPIHPISNGKITETHYDLWGLGHHVVIEHDQGYRSTYGHLDRIYARVGDTVTSDSTIGTVGMTGYTSGPHTHLEVTKNGGYIDPMTILPAISDIPQGYPLYQAEASTSGQLVSQGTDAAPVIPPAVPTENRAEPSLNLKKELKFNL